MAVQEMRLALRNMGKIDPESIDDYIAVGGYEALKKARQMDRDELISQVENASKLRGRGGAGFNTGFKWSGAKASKGDRKYIVCNADEGEPGTFKDRVILENDPHTVLEGILIAAYAVGASNAIIYCRGEYEKQIGLLRHAVKQVQEKGLAGDVTVEVYSGAGSYVCGEETALLNSIEGKRAEPRMKPPYPTVAGAFGKPTVVNNVETFANVPVIVSKGAEWYSQVGAKDYPGTKIFSISGDVKRPGCYEVATDATLNNVVIDLAGGVRDGHTLKAIQLGPHADTSRAPSLTNLWTLIPCAATASLWALVPCWYSTRPTTWWTRSSRFFTLCAMNPAENARHAERGSIRPVSS